MSAALAFLRPLPPSPPRRAVAVGGDTEGPRYATPKARSEANARGMNIGNATWRDIFLAITDTMVPSAACAATATTAKYRGRVRDGERWSIKQRHHEFDVIYDPLSALVTGVTAPLHPS